eukprot:UN05104
MDEQRKGKLYLCLAWVSLLGFQGTQIYSIIYLILFWNDQTTFRIVFWLTVLIVFTLVEFRDSSIYYKRYIFYSGLGEPEEDIEGNETPTNRLKNIGLNKSPRFLEKKSSSRFSLLTTDHNSVNSHGDVFAIVK